MGEVGEYVVIARKDGSSEDWYLGALTNELPREIALDLSLLDCQRSYQANLYLESGDAHGRNNPYGLSIEERE